jgi:hypothetical protein
MMINSLSIVMLLSIILIGTTLGVTYAQSENTSDKVGGGGGTTNAIANFTNSSSPENSTNMSAMRSTMNGTG